MTHHAPFRPQPPHGRRVLALIIVAATATAVLSGNAATAASGPDACSTATSPLTGARVVTVYSRPGNIVREFLRPGRSPIFISSADLLHTAVLPVLGRTVTQRQQVRSMMGPALSATNGDFFTIYGADGVEVAPGGIPVKGTSYYQPAIVIDDHRNPLISQVKLSIALHSRPSPTHTIVVDAQAYNSARPAVDGLSVFDSRWGAPALLGSMRWQPQPATSYTVAGGRVISVVPGVSTVAIPAGGFRVVAQGNGNGRLVAAGWHVGTTVARFVAAQAPDLRHVNGALGVGRPTITGGHILGSACGFDVATPRTLFGILPGGRTAVLVAASGQGLTMRESNALMRGIGVASAAMLDGGGSTVMTVRTTGPVQLTVHPYRYEGDRPVPDALGVFAR